MFRDSERRTRILFCFIMAMAFFFRLLQLGHESLWIDEIYSVRIAVMNLAEVLSNRDVHPPLYLAMLHFWIRLFGISEAAIRGFSVLFGMLTVWMVYRLGKIMFNSQTAVIAAGLVSLSAFHIQYSQEARSYSFLSFLTAGSFYLFARLLERPKASLFLAYTAATTLLLYTHNFAAFAVLSQNIFWLGWTLAQKTKNILFIRKWLAIQLLVFTLYAPWLWQTLLISSGMKQNYWIEAPTLHSLIDTLREYAGGYKLLGLFSIGLAWVFWQGSSGRSPHRRDIFLLTTWLSVGLLVPFVISKLWTPVYYTRYTIGCSIPFYLLAAHALDRLPWHLMKKIILGLVITLSLASVSIYYSEVKKEQWREVARFVDAAALPMDLIVFHRAGKTAFDYYSKKEGFTEKEFPPRNKSGIEGEKEKRITPENLETLLPMTEGHDRVWLILSHSRDKEGLLPKILEQKYRPSKHRSFYQINVTLYEKNNGGDRI